MEVGVKSRQRGKQGSGKGRESERKRESKERRKVNEVMHVILSRTVPNTEEAFIERWFFSSLPVTFNEIRRKEEGEKEETRKRR